MSGEAGKAEPAGADRLRVFISYARTDASDFAEYLVVALELAGFEAYLDRHDIAKAEDWEARLDELIAGSDSVVFVITPASIRSTRCIWEVRRTQASGKRLVPVQWIAVPEVDVPTELKRLNYTIFTSGDPFGGPLGELAGALRQDLGWLRQQTRLNEQAARWDERGRDTDLLLRGTALTEARDWMARRRPDAPEISPLVNAFIGLSEEARAAQQNEARKQLEEREKLVAAAEQAQAERAVAAAEKLESSRRLARRTLIGIAAALVLLGVAIVAGVIAWNLADYARILQEQAMNLQVQARNLQEQARNLQQETQVLAERAAAETARADQFVDLVNSNEAGLRAMKKICLEAIETTAMLATTAEQAQNARARDRFWELYYGPMYIVELHQTRETRARGGSGSAIEAAMVRFGRSFENAEKAGAGLPRKELCPDAKSVRQECVSHLNIGAPETCP